MSFLSAPNEHLLFRLIGYQITATCAATKRNTYSAMHPPNEEQNGYHYTGYNKKCLHVEKLLTQGNTEKHMVKTAQNVNQGLISHC